MYGEAIVYDLAARVLRGEPLYQPLDRAPYVVVAYAAVLLARGRPAVDDRARVPARARPVLRRGPRDDGHGRLPRGAAPRPVAAGCWPRSSISDLVYGRRMGASVSGRHGRRRAGTRLGRHARRRDDHSPGHPGGTLAALAVLTKQTLIVAALAGSTWLWRVDRARPRYSRPRATIVLATCASLEVAASAFLDNAGPLESESVQPRRADGEPGVARRVPGSAAGSDVPASPGRGATDHGPKRSSCSTTGPLRCARPGLCKVGSTITTGSSWPRRAQSWPRSAWTRPRPGSGRRAPADRPSSRSSCSE